jgi:hypothetical protein
LKVVSQRLPCVHAGFELVASFLAATLADKNLKQIK